MTAKTRLAGILIIVFAVVALACYLYGHHLQITADRFGFHRAQGDHLYVQFSDHLLAFDNNNTEVAKYSLADMGIKPHGDFAFFGNGDLLIYHLSEQPGLIYDLSRYFRQQKKDTEPAEDESGFYRCKLEEAECTRFARELPLLESAFRLCVLQHKDHIVLADTPAFKLYLLDDSGSLLATSEEGSFHFPNQLLAANKQLWLADTNNHRVVKIDDNELSFAEVGDSFPVDLGGEYRWPHQLAREGENWWINVGDRALANGRIIKADKEGNFLFEISPRAVGLRDPLAISFWNDALWVSDFKEPKLTRFSSDGKTLAEPTSNSLKILGQQASEQINTGKILRYAGMLLGAVVLICGLIAAWVLDKEQTKKHLGLFASNTLMEELIKQAPKEAPGNRILWIENRLKKYRLLSNILLSALPTAIIIATVYLLVNSPQPRQEILFHALPLALFVSSFSVTVWLMLNKIQQQSLGVINNTIVLKLSGGRKIQAEGKDLVYNERLISAKGITVLLGQSRKRFFNTDELNQYVLPRLKGARKCSEWEAFKFNLTEHRLYFIGLFFTLILVPALSYLLRF